jgi:hypothetical protein
MSQWPYNTQRWQRYRRQKLQERPLCEYCLNEGRLTVAVAMAERARPNSNREKLSLPKSEQRTQDIIDADVGEWPPLIVVRPK